MALKAVNARKGRCVLVIVTVANPVASCVVRVEGRRSEKEIVCVLRVMNIIINSNNDIIVYVSRTVSSSSCCEIITVRTFR